MNKDEQLKKVLSDYAAGRLSARETKKLEHLILKYPSGESWDWKDSRHKEAVKDRIQAGIAAHHNSKAKIRRINIRIAVSIAAAFVCFFIFLYLYLIPGATDTFYTIAQSKSYSSDKVVLILPDGKQFPLKDSASFTQLKRELGLQMKSLGLENRITVSVPDQKQFKLTLEDGTNVWLNAGSTLRFSYNLYKQTARKVQLEGEAYFEVASDKLHPFHVFGGGAEVKVTGTKFNVQAFESDHFVRTSLAEGIVTFYMDHKAYKLVPGMEVIADTERKNVSAQSFDIDKLLSWKEGYFVFDNIELVDVMKAVSRWYNIAVVAKSPVKSKKIGGTFPKNVPLIDFLNDLTLLSGVEFKINGKEVEILN
ncbi:MAG: DUF4974 domain-containing protein [Sphingobacterium sp.]|jgi:hypothetical protein|nr:DUF4974 domain-containing protein [Sphingobacterium sp.]